jgi:hypothetical protein
MCNIKDPDTSALSESCSTTASPGCSSPAEHVVNSAVQYLSGFSWWTWRDVCGVVRCLLVECRFWVGLHGGIVTEQQQTDETL